ncbi:7TM diverse intracellular signaling domain-containing protein [Runella limosa]|uniref:7TM diverse intracellular signaling domain-containing protein n=1 Tax=Runella limosa TaxID=370978 RepID=UPI0009FEF00B|nr:7TM diverse intracellular signaling domain-containing protein [Runella limosa]
MRLVVVCISLLFSVSLCAQNRFTYQLSDELQSIEPFTYFLIDSSKTLTFNQLRQLPDKAFTQNTKSFLNFGNTEYPIWLRIDVENSSNEALFLIQELHDVRLLDVYLLDENDSLRTWKTGAMRPFGTHFLKRSNTIFDLGKSPKRVYLRIQNTSVYVPLKMGTIQAVSNYLHKYDLLYGAIYGVLLALMFYNLFVFLIVRDRVFLYYFFYILTSGYIIFKADNHHHEFIFKQIPNFSSDINLSSLITLFFIILFANAYLRMKELTPKFFWTLVILWCIGLVLMPFEWLPYRGWVNDVFQLLVISIMLVLLGASIYIHFLGFKHARYFVLAFGFYIYGVVNVLLGFMGIVSMNNLRSAYIYQICSVLEAIFFAFAVAYRFNTYRKEAKDAQEIALKRSQEHEALLQKNSQLLAEKLQIEQNLQTVSANKDFNQLLQQIKSDSQPIKKISIPTVEGVILFPEQDISRLEAMGSYCTIYLTDHKKITTSKPMAHFEQMIDERQFMRIHKSHIVNLDNVTRYIRGEGGSVEMKDKSVVPVSRRMKNELLQRLAIETPAV